MVCRELVGVDEQPESWIAAAQHAHLGDAGNPFQLVIELLIDEAIDVRRIKLSLGRGHLIGQQDRGRALHHRHPRGRHLLRQLGHGQGHAVLHVHLVDVDISVFVEINLNDALPRVRASGGDIGSTRHTVDLLLERIGNGLFSNYGISPAVIGRHLNQGRRDVGEVLNRQTWDRDDAHQHDQNAANGGQNRPLDELV